MTRDQAIDIVARATAQATWQQTRAVGVLVGLARRKWRASVLILRSDLKDTGALEAE